VQTVILGGALSLQWWKIHGSKCFIFLRLYVKYYKLHPILHYHILKFEVKDNYQNEPL